MKRYRNPTYEIPWKNEWRVWSDEGVDSGEYGPPEAIDGLIYDYQKNPAAFFCPHGRKRKGKWENDGLAALNDWEKDMLIVTAPNQVGKSTIAALRLFYYLCPTDKNWPCFTQHGIDWHPWGGPKIAVVASYEWTNTYDMWESAYQKFWPREELGVRAPLYGAMFPDEEKEKGRPFPRGFKRGVEVLDLKCGSKIIFLCYGQNLGAWAGRQCDIAHLDEQCPEDLFDELTQRQTTRGIVVPGRKGKYHPIIMPMTPHLVEGRPDTGAAGWINRQVLNGGVTKGRTPVHYVIDMECVPDVIIDPQTKKEKYTQWVKEPERLHNEKKMREGRARYYGEPEEGGGIIISAYSPTIHIIEPFDIFKHKPLIYRMIDHGENPCAAALIALMPWGDAVLYKEYYVFGRSIAANAKGIAEEMCGNEIRELTDDGAFEGMTWGVFEEVFKTTRFVSSEMDSKSYGRPLKESCRLIGQAYVQGGCRCTAADGRDNHTKDNDGLIDLLCQWFELDQNREHINKKLGREIPEVLKKAGTGAPRFYMFNDCINAKYEIEGWVRNPKTGKPMDKNDHLCSCLKFFAGKPRVYHPSLLDGQYETMAGIEDDKPKHTGAHSDITGY